MKTIISYKKCMNKEQCKSSVFALDQSFCVVEKLLKCKW